WSVTGSTYTVSGTYTLVTGCHTEILDLTIISNTTNAATVVSQCGGSYTWAVNGITYTASANASFTNPTTCVTDILNLTITASTTNTSTVSSCIPYTWSVTGSTYTVSGTYTLVTGCHTEILNLTMNAGSLLLSCKAILDGAYDSNTGLMNDSLRVKNLIPLNEPYSSSPYSKAAILELNNESISPTILSITGSNAIVDWVFLELRDAANPALVVANKRALIQRDGDIVSHTDGVSPVLFSMTSSGSYYISLKHRNHLGVMTSNAYNFNGCGVLSIDFTSSSPVYVNSGILFAPRKLNGTIYTLWSGDAKNNRNVKYNGLNNDKDQVLSAVGGLNSVLSNVYRMEDLNMDSKVKFNGSDNDRVVILSTLGLSTPNIILSQHTPN
ncbi:MAG TPA: hypothetical protein PLU17_14025, partial [Chitinophagaceae bacterium]|nr:hypothetical protein [Chitinophagaceae bacterium]